jgi:acetylornithine/LysW-gamma-L-lysine aminotransferase
LACAAAVATINVLVDQDLPRQAAETGAYFVRRLREIENPRFREIRGLGLMIGVELKDKAGPIAQALMEKGVLVLLAGTTVLRFLPPLVINREQVDQVVKTLATVLAAGPRATAE